MSTIVIEIRRFGPTTIAIKRQIYYILKLLDGL